MSEQTITISIDQGLAARHASLLSVCSQGIYQRGLSNVAGSINRDPGNLSRELNGNGRHLSVETLEAYIAATGDLAPVHYLVERFLISKAQDTAAIRAQAARLINQLQPLLAAGGL